LGVCLAIALLAARTQVTLPLALYAKDFYTFGYLRSEQRAEFDVLAGLAPTGSIVATSLNSGPIELYTSHHPVRPAYWSQSEWLDFVSQAFKDGRRVYLLVDGVEMHRPLKTLQSSYQLRQTSLLGVPYFNLDGTTEDLVVPLYEALNSHPK
jgi:hypothetical protein